MSLTRRELCGGVAMFAMAGALAPSPLSARLAGFAGFPVQARPLPLSAVRLLPSDYATAVEVNRGYLMRLEPDRLLHNFRLFAGLEPKAPIYGGWESDSIAGHILGHYLSAAALMHAQTGDAEMCRRANYIVDELELCQNARGTGYVGALLRKRKDGTFVDGEEIFPELLRGKILSGGFDLNGSWSPLYTVHKLFAGLLDVNAMCSNAKAMKVLDGLANYFARLFEGLTDAQLQEVLNCEYGGLNESYAELYARTGNARWLAVAERIYDKRVLDSLVAQEDKLANFHANTQVPKLIGLARIHEVSGKEYGKSAASFFWQTVTDHHSYVIGGNADREYFFEPDKIADHITEQTCEHCNSYNMLKLTEHLYGWHPDASLFDYFERTHLNHVLSAQNPHTAGFTYMTPLMSGTAREYSEPGVDAFWCCVGSGMESHAKHGHSIFWEGEGMLLVNLYIPAQVRWETRKAEFTLDTNYPFEPESRLKIDRIAKPGRFPIALRVPGWAAAKASVTVNGLPAEPQYSQGYAIVDRLWKAGDELAIVTPLELRLEPTAGDPQTVAVMRGPLVLAADLGTTENPFEGQAPAMVGDDPLVRLKVMAADRGVYASEGLLRPKDYPFVPFYSQYDRRSAVYFKRFTESEWLVEEANYMAAQERAKNIAARSADVMHLGEMQPERDHNLVSEISYPVAYRGKSGRDARAGGYFEFTMKTKPGPLVLQATYWGSERSRIFDILVDGVKVATQRLDADHPGEFFDVEYPLPQELTSNKQEIRIKLLPHDRTTAGPVFGMRLFMAKDGPTQ